MADSPARRRRDSKPDPFASAATKRYAHTLRRDAFDADDSALPVLTGDPREDSHDDIMTIAMPAIEYPAAVLKRDRELAVPIVEGAPGAAATPDSHRLTRPALISPSGEAMPPPASAAREPTPPRAHPRTEPRESTPPRAHPRTEPRESTPPRAHPRTEPREPTPPRAHPRTEAREPTPARPQPRTEAREPTPARPQPRTEARESTPPRPQPRAEARESTPPRSQPRAEPREPTPPRTRSRGPEGLPRLLDPAGSLPVPAGGPSAPPPSAAVSARPAASAIPRHPAAPRRALTLGLLPVVLFVVLAALALWFLHSI
jgi:hypothetical protein